MRWLVLLLLVSGCDWYAPEGQACRANSYCPDGFECDLEPGQDVGLCARSNDSSAPPDDDDATTDDDDFAPVEEGVRIELPVDGSTVWIDEGLHFEAVIGFPADADDGRSITLSLAEEVLWFDDDVDGWEGYDADNGRIGGWIPPGAWDPGQAAVTISATAGAWWREGLASIDLAVLPDGWHDRDGDGWCPGEGIPAGTGTPPGLGGRDFDHDGICDTQERDNADLFDCDDNDTVTRPEGIEACDGIDTDCDGEIGADEVDGDGDGFMACSDCDDTDPSVNTGGTEVCDGVDNDCDGTVDENEDEADPGEVAADEGATLLDLVRSEAQKLVACPVAPNTLPTCTSTGTPLCAVGASAAGAFSIPGDNLDAWRFSWVSTSGLSAVGCPTTVTVTPSPGQDLDAELWIVPTDTTPLADWFGPLPLVDDPDGILALTLDESDPLLAGASFEDVAFVIAISPTDSVAQCPTDGYTVSVEGY